MTLTDTVVKSELKKHAARTLFIDFLGVLLNILILPAGVYVFLFLAAQRLDGANSVSWYVIMTPVWVTFIPVILYILLHGVAAKNLRISTLEKCILSLFVPTGFLATLITLMWYSESTEANETTAKLLKFIFLPHFISLLCLYLYLRCLLPPVRVQSA